MKKTFQLLTIVIMLCILTACSDDDSSSTNHAPVANAGADQSVIVNTLITLDGSSSTDRDGDILSYNWLIVSAPAGSAANLSDQTIVRPTFTADQVGTYEISLVVNDGEDDSAEDVIVVTAASANAAPIANAGTDQNVATGATVTLDASGSSDADGDSLSYAWSIINAPTGSTSTLSSSIIQAPTFTADLDGTYEIQLIVNDGAIDSATDTVIITAATTNSTPVANAGPGQNVNVGDLVTLDGSSSSDADGDLLVYNWSLTSAPTGSSANLFDATAVNPNFTADVYGDYVFSLTVDDGTATSSIDTVTISTQFAPPANHVAVNFTIDDSANQTYDNSDGLAWKGSFSFSPATRILSFNGSWGGPYAMLYDDGPWTSGGHEPEGASAGDHIWGVTVWVSNTNTQYFEYGAIRNSVDGSDGAWIWTGANGTFTVNAGATSAIDATGLSIAAHGTIDLCLTIDISANASNLALPFQGTDYANKVQVKGSAWNWNLVTADDDGNDCDSTANDGIYSFILSEAIGKHDGLLLSGATSEFIFVLDGVEYRTAGAASDIGVSAYTSPLGSWIQQPVKVYADGSLNTYITVP